MNDEVETNESIEKHYSKKYEWPKGENIHREKLIEMARLLENNLANVVNNDAYQAMKLVAQHCRNLSSDMPPDFKPMAKNIKAWIMMRHRINTDKRPNSDGHKYIFVNIDRFSEQLAMIFQPLEGKYHDNLWKN